MATIKKAGNKVASATTKKSTKAVVKLTNAQTDEKTVKDTVKKIVESTREVKYIYPEDKNTQELRKAYRVQVRNKDKAYLKDLDTAKKGKDEKRLTNLKTAYAKFRKAHYLVP
jgi:aspartate/methionine/tyrosine aminotransferase